MPQEHGGTNAGDTARSLTGRTTSRSADGRENRILSRRSGSQQLEAPPRLINIDELSDRLNLATGTLYNWVYLRRIPFIKAGRCVRFDYDAVLAALRQGTLEEVSRR